MIVLVTCKNVEDQIKNKGARVVTRLFINFSNAQWQLTSVVGGRILTKFRLIEAFMVALVTKCTCKNEEDSSKNEGIREVTQFLPL